MGLLAPGDWPRAAARPRRQGRNCGQPRHVTAGLPWRGGGAFRHVGYPRAPHRRFRQPALRAQRLVQPLLRRREAGPAGQRGAEALFCGRRVSTAQRELPQQYLRIRAVRHLAAAGTAQNAFGFVQRVAADGGAGVQQLLAIGGAIQRRLPLRCTGGVGGDSAFQQRPCLGAAAFAEACHPQAAQRVGIAGVCGQGGFELAGGVAKTARFQPRETFASGCDARIRRGGGGRAGLDACLGMAQLRIIGETTQEGLDLRRGGGVGRAPDQRLAPGGAGVGTHLGVGPHPARGPPWPAPARHPPVAPTRSDICASPHRQLPSPQFPMSGSAGRRASHPSTARHRAGRRRRAPPPPPAPSLRAGIAGRHRAPTSAGSRNSARWSRRRFPARSRRGRRRRRPVAARV